jgi:hypothetical protein
MGGWRAFALRSLFAGAGFALAVLIVLAIFAWYRSRPEPPQSWNTSAIVANDPPSFTASKDGNRIEFRYVLENTTDADYEIHADYTFKVTIRGTKGTLTQPLKSEQASLTLPVFVPARQRAAAKISIALANIPTRKTDESEEAYHERLRVYLQDYLKNFANFVVFDDLHHYEISLPRWKSAKDT